MLWYKNKHTFLTFPKVKKKQKTLISYIFQFKQKKRSYETKQSKKYRKDNKERNKKQTKHIKQKANKNKKKQNKQSKIILLTFGGRLVIEVQGLHYQRVGPLKEKNTHMQSAVKPKQRNIKDHFTSTEL